jgi:hypothetical protein
MLHLHQAVGTPAHTHQLQGHLWALLCLQAKAEASLQQRAGQCKQGSLHPGNCNKLAKVVRAHLPSGNTVPSFCCSEDCKPDKPSNSIVAVANTL